MANLTTTPDLVTFVLEGMREPTDGTSAYAVKALTQLNRSYRAIWAGGVGLNVEAGMPVTFPWARAQYPKVVTLSAPIETGTIAATNGSTSVTFSDAPASSVTGWFLKVGSDPEVYRVDAHTGGATGATLDGAFVGADVTAETYVLFKTRYTLSDDVLAICSPLTAYGDDGDHEIQVISKSVLNRDWPLTDVEEDFPTRAAVVYQGEGTLDLQFNAYPTETERVECEYIAIPTPLDLVGSDPLMPVHQRVVVAEFALAAMLEEMDDDRAPTHLAMAKAGFKDMVAEMKGLTSAGSRNKGRIVPWQDDFNEDDIVRTSSGFIIDLG